ncbi:MAG: hypothetical protein MUF71_08745 [Candidatus Kapabacteria bacterium]|jgi:hypothetical protein|nr:hypothetical protein [Candidatus Kapabacteria bacterium]
MMRKISKEQQARFCEHLAGSHSWYKHLPLLHGGRFFIFTDNDAGKNYPVQPPRLASGNTKAVYQMAFGTLAFAWSRGNEDCFVSDGGLFTGILTEEELRVRFPNHAQIQLFPYISGEFVESIIFHEKDFETLRLENGTPENQHENRALLIEIELLYLREEYLWQTAFTDVEREEIICDIEPDEISPNRDKYKRLEKRIGEILSELYESEIKKVEAAVRAVCQQSEVLWAK